MFAIVSQLENKCRLATLPRCRGKKGNNSIIFNYKINTCMLKYGGGRITSRPSCTDNDFEVARAVRLNPTVGDQVALDYRHLKGITAISSFLCCSTFSPIFNRKGTFVDIDWIGLDSQHTSIKDGIFISQLS